ncbi:hypothetical protein LTR56_012858 [Elasticomyces elasticus]|nr:hypothetical protein LTR56_012858 [Elasticomyces elasticus]KAK3650784.1 hypothetical protein LTR22_012383 [Elasticomyces elasticus]KAK4918488.1 hypothetical protein LTR49_013721 [Elasticomyces elasticus]KAK5757873.1 hypothetical protein LTS12_012057 [Elasticomyces elasticus]
MKTSTALIALASVVSFMVPSATAGCYTSGDKYPDTNQAQSYLDGICRDLATYYQPSEHKNLCRYPGNNFGINLEIQNMNTRNGFSMAYGDCVNGLRNEIVGCSRGGDTTNNVSLWRFRLDPGRNGGEDQGVC